MNRDGQFNSKKHSLFLSPSFRRTISFYRIFIYQLHIRINRSIIYAFIQINDNTGILSLWKSILMISHALRCAKFNINIIIIQIHTIVARGYFFSFTREFGCIATIPFFFFPLIQLYVSHIWHN